MLISVEFGGTTRVGWRARVSSHCLLVARSRDLSLVAWRARSQLSRAHGDPPVGSGGSGLARLVGAERRLSFVRVFSLGRSRRRSGSAK